eukprot:Skav215855  [mRNA]  locus=scaffold1630:262515:268058:- [translate_table: standard]
MKHEGLTLHTRHTDPCATAVSASRVDLVPVPLLMDAVAERNPVPRDAKREDEANEARPPSPLKQETWQTWQAVQRFFSGARSWLERIHALAGGGPLRPEVQRQLASLSSAAAQTLQLAASLGTVVIITNSAPGWVDQSCQIFMPQILQQAGKKADGATAPRRICCKQSSGTRRGDKELHSFD